MSVAVSWRLRRTIAGYNDANGPGSGSPVDFAGTKKFRNDRMERLMKRFVFLMSAVLTLGAASTLWADSLELADGTVLEGDFVGASNGIIMFDTGEGIEAFAEDEVVGLFLSEGVETMQQAANASVVTVPSGTRMVLRMVEDIDTSRHAAGHRFRAQLEGALVVNGVQAVPRGTFVHGRIISASQSRRAVGSSDLAMDFTDLMINDELIPIQTSGLQAQTQNEAGRTVGRTARAAAVGGLIGGSSGARTGAKVGAGASILTSGASINVPRGTILEVNLAAPVNIQM
jgi:hypothetical protein